MRKHTVDIYTMVKDGNRTEFYGTINGERTLALFGDKSHTIENVVEQTERDLFEQIFRYCLDKCLVTACAIMMNRKDYNLEFHILQEN